MDEGELNELLYPCVRCGYCCKTIICYYGEPNLQGCCKFLIVDNATLGTYMCRIIDIIKAFEKKSRYPMFGCGCSSTLFNNYRDGIIKKLKGLNDEEIQGVVL